MHKQVMLRQLEFTKTAGKGTVCLKNLISRSPLTQEELINVTWF